MTDKTTPFSFDAWWAVYEGLKGSPWEDEDVTGAGEWPTHGTPDAAPAAETLKYTYDRAKEWEGPVDPEDGVAAVLNATYEFHASNEWTPLQVGEMADHFAVFHADMDTPLRDYLDEHHGNLPPEWLTDRARMDLEEGLPKESEIWVTEGPPGVWVFNKPGRKP